MESNRKQIKRREKVLKDMRVLGVKNWTTVMMDKWAWYYMMEKSKTHRGL